LVDGTGKPSLELKCSECGTVLLEIPEHPQENDLVRCTLCQATLGTWGEIQNSFLRQAGAAFVLEEGEIKRIA
jgi:DNA-directed RNA polymerase subunit RPC12/RpoP